MDTKKKVFIYAGVIVLLLASVIGWTFRLGDRLPEMGLIAFLILSVLLIAWGLEGDGSPEKKIRIFTHAAMCFLSVQLVCVFSRLGQWRAIAVALGVYFAAYYVLSIVLVPLNIFYRRQGYRPFYVLFYPFLSRRRRGLLLFGGGSGEKGEKFVFDAAGRRGEVIGEFFFVEGNVYGEVRLPESCLCIEFPLPPSGWTAEDFDAFAKKIAGADFRAVGYCIFSDGGAEKTVRVLSLPDPGHYRRGKKACDRFFSKRGIQKTSFLFSYLNFKEEVLTEILPYHFSEDEAETDATKDFDREKTAFYNDVLLWIYEKDLTRRKGGLVDFSVAFPADATYGRMEKFASEREEEGFLCCCIFATHPEKGEGEGERKYPCETERSNSVFLTKTVGFLSVTGSARLRLIWALNLYKKLFSMTGREFEDLRGQLGPKREEWKARDKDRLEISEKMIRSVLRGVRTENEQDLMYEADLRFSLEDFYDAGLVWLTDRKTWGTREQTSAVSRMFGLLSAEQENEGEPISGDELTTTLEKLHGAARKAGALNISWMF